MGLSDRQITELAAMAIGIQGEWSDSIQALCYPSPLNNSIKAYFEPLKHSRVALCLSAELKLDILHSHRNVDIKKAGVLVYSTFVADETTREKLMRRALAYAAAEIGDRPTPISPLTAELVTPSKHIGAVMGEAWYRVTVGLISGRMECARLWAASEQDAIRKVNNMDISEYLGLERYIM